MKDYPLKDSEFLNHYFGMDINKYIQKRIRENMGLKPEEVDNDHCEQLIQPQTNERNKNENI